MWRILLTMTLLLGALTVRVPFSRADERYLMDQGGRRAFPGGQPSRAKGSGGGGTLPQTTYQKKTETVFPTPQERTRDTRSDWEFVQSIANEEAFPYHWKTHRGKAEQCIALIQVRTPGGLKTYNALVIRCDGFLMAPQSVWDAVKEKLPVSVWVTNAEGEDSHGPFPIRHRNPHKSRYKDYHFVKVNSHHLRCLPVLASWNLAPETPVRLVWATLDKDGQSLVPQSVSALCQPQPKPREDNSYDLGFKPGTQPGRVPDGTLVIDEESGAALGMIPDGTQPSRFVTTRRFGELCEEVALAPHRAAAMGKDPKEIDPAQGANMVKVAGGAIVYDNKEFIRTYQTALACTPDFYCDKYLVTVGEWQKFLEFRTDRPLPEGWDARNRINPPTRYPKLPVVGTMAGDMQDYASWQNKRLITGVEWIRAAQTTQLDWLDRLQDHVNRLQSVLLQTKQSFQDAAHRRSVQLAMDTTLTATAVRQAGPGGRIINRRPNDSITDLTLSYVQALRQLQSEYSSVLTTLPGQPLEVGTRGEDKSDWGVFDMNLNAPEACLGWGRNYGFTPKLLPAGQNPFTTTIYYLSDYSLPLLNNAPQTSTLVGSLATASLSDPLVWAGAWLSQFGGVYRDQPVDFRPESNPGSTSTRPENRMKAGFFFLEVNASSGLAFRCAL